MKKLITIMISGLWLVACSNDDNKGTPSETVIATSTGTWTVYTLTTGPNPAAMITGTAKAVKEGASGMRVDLDYAGLPANMAFGSHIHKLDCATNMAGGHYQNNLNNVNDAGNDPTFANATNEVWMDFTTDATGKVKKSISSSFVPRAGEAKAIVVHAMSTAVGGVAGAKLACLNLPF
jgi:superoxide dismutase, Cu-Zn family